MNLFWVLPFLTSEVFWVGRYTTLPVLKSLFLTFTRFTYATQPYSDWWRWTFMKVSTVYFVRNLKSSMLNSRRPTRLLAEPAVIVAKRSELGFWDGVIRCAGPGTLPRIQVWTVTCYLKYSPWTVLVPTLSE